MSILTHTSKTLKSYSRLITGLVLVGLVLTPLEALGLVSRWIRRVDANLA